MRRILQDWSSMQLSELSLTTDVPVGCRTHVAIHARPLWMPTLPTRFPPLIMGIYQTSQFLRSPINGEREFRNYYSTRFAQKVVDKQSRLCRLRCCKPTAYRKELFFHEAMPPPWFRHERVEAEPRTNTAVVGKPEAYRKESGEAAGRRIKASLQDFLCKAILTFEEHV